MVTIRALHLGRWFRSPRGASIPLLVARAIVLGFCLLIMLNWPAGLDADALLMGAAAGLLFPIPYTVPAWSCLALVLATALALAFGDQNVASGFTGMATYALAVACLWGLWEHVVLRARRGTAPACAGAGRVATTLRGGSESGPHATVQRDGTPDAI